MASRYYNPRLASSVGAAQGEQYVSLEPAVAGARQILKQADIERKRAEMLRIKQRQEEAKAFAEEMERRDDVLYAAQKNLQDSSNLIDNAPPAIKARVTALATLAKDNFDILQTGIKKGQIKRGSALIWQDENVNKYIKDAKNLLESWPEIIGNISANAPSVINSSTDLKITRKITEGAFAFDEKGMAKIYDDDETTVIKEISIDDLKNLQYIPIDTEAFTTAFNTVNTAADKAANKGKSLDSMLVDVDTALSGLNFTPQQTLSIAFDYLAKERPEYADLKKYINENGEIDTKKFKQEIDSDGDGVPGEPEDLNLWVKEQLKEAAKNAYSGYQKDYADKFSTNNKETDLKNTATNLIDEFNNAQGQFDFSILHNLKYGGKNIAGSQVRNGKLYLEYIARTTGEGQEIAELPPIDLNDKTAIRLLFTEYVKQQKGLSEANKIMKFINDEDILTFNDASANMSILFPSPSTKNPLP